MFSAANAGSNLSGNPLSPKGKQARSLGRRFPDSKLWNHGSSEISWQLGARGLKRQPETFSVWHAENSGLHMSEEQL